MLLDQSYLCPRLTAKEQTEDHHIHFSSFIALFDARTSNFDAVLFSARTSGGGCGADGSGVRGLTHTGRLDLDGTAKPVGAGRHSSSGGDARRTCTELVG